MTLTLLSLMLLSTPGYAAKTQVSCTAVYRTLDDRNNTVERTAEVPAKAVVGEQVKHELAFQGRTFLLTEDRGDLFAQIAIPGDLAKGVTARGTPDSQGRFTLAEVAGFTVYRLECTRN